MLPVQPFRQTPTYCGPACLKMVLAYYGVHKTEKELARLCSTDRSGTRPEHLVRGAHKLGFHAVLKEHATLADIKTYLSRKIPVIVDWFSADEGHYSVVIGMDRTHIYLQDPELGKQRSIDLQTFQRIWFDFSSEHIRTPKDLRLRLLIAISPKK